MRAGLAAGVRSRGGQQVLLGTLGSLDVTVTLDDSNHLCTTIPNVPAYCLSVPKTPEKGIQSARLDAAPGGSYVLRLFVEPGTEFDDLPLPWTVRLAKNTELVTALYETAPACFHMTTADGEPHTMTVPGTVVDVDTEFTAATPADHAC